MSARALRSMSVHGGCVTFFGPGRVAGGVAVCAHVVALPTEARDDRHRHGGVLHISWSQSLPTVQEDEILLPLTVSAGSAGVALLVQPLTEWGAPVVE